MLVDCLATDAQVLANAFESDPGNAGRVSVAGKGCEYLDLCGPDGLVL